MGFDLADFASKLIIYMVVWLFAVSAHEAAHAWMSLKYGDDTAYLLGRVTLNPVPHIDPLGTLILPIIGFLVTYSPAAAAFPLIMWGKPTPVNPLRWRKKDQANVMVSLAGIGVNMIIAVTTAIIIWALSSYHVFTRESIATGMTQILWTLLVSTVTLNVGLAIFNLLPLPPLDGGMALRSFLPRSFEPVYELIETYGFLILIVLMYMGILSLNIAPIRNFIVNILLPS
jgi:Zn-dependent protease